MGQKMSSSSRRNNHYSTYDYTYPPKCEEVKRLERPPSNLPSHVCVKFGSQKICNENVDDVAGEFIKLEHRKFEASKTMSVNSG
ncbi:hypothetical protein LINGRAHAP2_LOCUS18395 [Linum grandiflorum]